MFCRIYQWQIEKEIDGYGQIKNTGLLKHLEKCPACLSWLQSLTQIERHLRTAPSNVSDLHMQQIQATVRRNLSDAATDHPVPIGHKMYKSYRIRYTVSAAVAVTAVVIGLFTLYSPESDKNNYNKTMESVTQLSGQLQYQTSALASLPEQMIESEMQNMETNIRQSIGFIQNCLPQGFVVANLSSENIEIQ